MIIEIYVMCRKCFKGETREVSVLQVGAVKNIKTVPSWKCSFCGNYAAYWSWGRSINRELFLGQITISKAMALDSYHGTQTFGCTTDVGLDLPLDFVISFKDPITRENL